MEAMFMMLREFLSKVMGAVETRHHDGKRTKDEGSGVRSFVSLGQWIKCNRQAVKAAIANDGELFMLIMKQATHTLNTYIRTGVWNRVLWVISYDDRLFVDSTAVFTNLKVHFVWTPRDGKSMTKDEENRFLGKMKNVAFSYQKAGYDVICYEIKGWTSTPNAEGSVKYVDYSSGNVFELLHDFFGRDIQELEKFISQSRMQGAIHHE